MKSSEINGVKITAYAWPGMADIDRQPLTKDYIVDIVCKKLSLTRSEFFNKSRRRELVFARQVAWYIMLNNIPTATYPNIASYFCIHRSTVHKGLKYLQNLIDTEPATKNQVKNIEAHCKINSKVTHEETNRIPV